MILFEHIALPFDEHVDQFDEDLCVVIEQGLRVYWAVKDVAKGCVSKIAAVVGRYRGV